MYLTINEKSKKLVRKKSGRDNIARNDLDLTIFIPTYMKFQFNAPCYMFSII